MIFEGCTNRARPSQPSLKNCQNGIFSPVHVIQIFFEPNYSFWSALKVPPSDFIQNMSQAPSKCLKQQIKVDKLDFLTVTYLDPLPTLRSHVKELTPLIFVATHRNLLKSKFTTQNHEHKSTLAPIAIFISCSSKLKKNICMMRYQSWTS